MLVMFLDMLMKLEYNFIDDFSIINMKWINLEILLRFGDFFCSDLFCGIFKFIWFIGDIMENSN